MKRILLFSILSFFMFQSCDLEEEILDEALNTDLLQGPGAAEGILAPVYARLYSTFNGHENMMLLQGVTTDEGIVPFRGGTDWFNGGRLIEAHRHTWTSSHSRALAVWNELTQGVARSAIAQNTLADIDDPNSTLFIAEARAMGAFFNSVLLDLFNVVFVKDPATINGGEESTVLRDGAAFDHIISELDAVESTLLTKDQVGPGRFTKGALWGLKARMFLNRAVYTDRYAASFNFSAEDMNEVIANCDRLINDGSYDLEREDYFKIFDLDNADHPEFVFVFDQTTDRNNGGRFTWFALARNHQFSLTNLGSTGTDGASITPDFWETWQDNREDPRFYKEIIPQDGSVTSIPEDQWALNRGILQGQQYGIVLNESGTDYKRDANGDLVIEMLFNTRRTGEPVDFTVACDLEVNTGHSTGARVSKYEVDPNATNGRNFNRSDIPLIRMGDIYLMRAEAKLRNGDEAGALADINALRTARNHPTLFDSISLEDIYNERGFELYWEFLRRPDMIRFGKFEDTWTSKTDNDPLTPDLPDPADGH